MSSDPRRGAVPTAAVVSLLVVFVVGVAGTVWSRASSDRAPRTLTITGSSTVAPLVSEIALRFEAAHPDVRVDVQAGGSSRGIGDARRGLADIGMVSRGLGPGESELRAWPLAGDGVALVVHAGNPVRELTTDQVRKIWLGELRDWEEAGGLPGPITVVHKSEGRATLEVFLDHFGLRNGDVEADVVVGGNQQAIRTVAGSPGAVGYVSIGEGEVEMARGVDIRLLPLEGVAARTEEVATGRFPMQRVLNLVTQGEPDPLTRRFIDFARSADAHDLIRAQAFVPLPGEGELAPEP